MSVRYPRCDVCNVLVPQVIDKVIGRKRWQLCLHCAEESAWFKEEPPEEYQPSLF